MEFIDALQFIIIIICMGSFIGLMLFMAIDGLTIKEIGKESVPCLDNRHRPFENEMCTKIITCSWIGLMTDKKCKDILSELNEGDNDGS